MPIVVSPSLTKTAGGQDMYQPISTNDNEVVNGTLTVTGTSTLTGAVSMGSTLAVTGLSSLNGGLAVTGPSTFNGALNASQIVVSSTGTTTTPTVLSSTLGSPTVLTANSGHVFISKNAGGNFGAGYVSNASWTINTVVVATINSSVLAQQAWSIFVKRDPATGVWGFYFDSTAPAGSFSGLDVSFIAINNVV